MLLRLMPHRGGDGKVRGIIAMDDTGSDMLSLFHSDVHYLGNTQGYTGWRGSARILCANGLISDHPTIEVEVELVRDDNTPVVRLDRRSRNGPARWTESIKAFGLWNQGGFLSGYWSG
jgi:hypothetical protein